MPVGMEIYDPVTGILRVALTTRVGKFSGSILTNGQQSGLVSVPDIIGRGSGVFLICFYSGIASFEVAPLPPLVGADTVLGQIGWEYKENVTAPARFHRITYGWF